MTPLLNQDALAAALLREMDSEDGRRKLLEKSPDTLAALAERRR